MNDLIESNQSKLVKLLPGQGSQNGFMVKTKAEAWSLVLLSVNITHRLVQSLNGWEILVNETDALVARHHLERYEAENSRWPTVKSSPASSPVVSWWTLLFCSLLVVFFSFTGPWSDSIWFTRGAIQSGAIKEQLQLWRLVTALTLHADIGHVMGNVCLGGVLIAFLAGLTGTGTAWMLAVLAGITGNLLNVFFHSGTHNSIGFSTAVFGVIGAFCGIRAFRDGMLNILLPLGAGLGLLAMLGAGGERTDLGAHVWGMIAGMGLGGAYHYFDPVQIYSKNGRLQNILTASVLVGVALAWSLALSG
nr:rhomboid family intramembrane serine protease [Desulfobulbaceae bacterium]